MLAQHMKIAHEGIHGLRLMKREYANRGKAQPRDRTLLTKAEFLDRIEPLMGLIADGALPIDDPTTAYILQQRLDAEHKQLKELTGVED